MKLSPNARGIASQENFIEKILHELDEIHNSLNIDCSDFIKRQPDAKVFFFVKYFKFYSSLYVQFLQKNKIVGQFKMLYGVLLNWYNSDCLEDISVIEHICNISLKLWPWTNISFNFQLIFLNCLCFLSEDSVFGITLNYSIRLDCCQFFLLIFIVCKSFSSYRIGTSASLLQKVAELVQIGTTRVKHPTSDLSALSKAMRILTNCCSCIEGRSFLTKVNILLLFQNFFNIRQIRIVVLPCARFLRKFLNK